jgi:phospholipid/cholesterol/gamma-HCH transport system substrate-binding protein
VIKQAPTTGRLLAMIAFALSCFGLLVFLWSTFGGPRPLAPQGWRMHVQFDEGIRLSSQADVRVSGVTIGKVHSVELDTRTGLTDAVLQIDDTFAPRPADSRATLRQRSLLGETYVELTPGSAGAPKLPEGGTLARAQVAETVEVDELFRTFDPETRRAFSAWMADQGAVLTAHGRALNGALAQLEPFTVEGGRALAVVRRQQEAASAFVRDSGIALGALSERRGQLASLVRSSSEVFAATAASDAALAGTIRELPAFLRETRATVDRAGRFAGRAQPLVDQLQPAAQPLSRLIVRARPVAGDLRRLFAGLGPLERAARRGLPAAESVLDESEPLLRRVQPFLGEIIPIAGYAADYRRELTATFANLASATQATTPPAGGGRPLHMLRAIAPLSAEGLAAYPSRLGTNRTSPYLAPGGYDKLASGLESFDASKCTALALPTLGDSVPVELRESISKFFLTPGLAGAPCRDQAPLGPSLTGTPGRFPRLSALPPSPIVPSITQEESSK